MKINLNQVLVDLAGDPLQDRSVKRDENGVVKDENGKPEMELVDVTLNRLAANALLHSAKDKQGNDLDKGEDKARKYLLATKCYPANEIDLTAEEIVEIKGCISGVYPSIVVGQAWVILDQKES